MASMRTDPGSGETAERSNITASRIPNFQHRRPTRIADLLIDAQPSCGLDALDSVAENATIAGLPDPKLGVNELRSGEAIAMNADFVLENGQPDGTEDDDNDEEEEEEEEDDGDDGDSCTSDEEETPLVVNPPKNVRNELISALKDCHNTTGSFFSSHSFSAGEAPNPMIWIDGFGILGLPLSVSEARRLIGSNAVQQAPFGMGERTVVDKAVRDTWEVDGSKVRFCNLTWIAWMNQVVIPHICEDLGVKRASALPEAELYKLLLYETGSHFLSHQDTAKAPGMFATIVVVLPSEFSGGSLHLSHAGETKIIDISTESLTMTHALAWYTDVFHSVLPVQSGYRLALSFNLVHSQSVKPSLQIFAEKTARLKHILLSWKQASEGRIALDEKPPDKLCYVLDHEYSYHDFITSERKGKDASLVAQLESIAMDVDFGIYIANIELYKQGSADDDGDDYRRKRKRYCAYEESDDEDSDVGFAQVFKQKLKISNIVDLFGVSNAPSKVSVKMSEIVPETFGTGEPDEKEYEGYMGNGAGSLEHWYRSSVLLFIPDNDFFGVGDVVEYSFATLPNVDSSKPSRKERKLVTILHESLLNGNPDTSRVQQAVSLLTGVALKWNDLKIWAKVISACPKILMLQSVGSQGFVRACSAFGFASMKRHLHSALAEDESNFRRFSVVEELLQLGVSNADEALKEWCRSQREIVISTLKQPAEEDVDVLVNITKERGVEFLRNNILSRFSKSSALSFFVAFLLKLEKEKRSMLIGLEKIDEILSEQFSAIMPDVPAYPFEVVKAKLSNEEDRREPLLELWLNYIKLCVSRNRLDLCSAYFKRMSDEYATGKQQDKDWIEEYFIRGAIAMLSAEASTYGPESLSLHSEFFKFAVDVYMTQTVERGKDLFDIRYIDFAARYSGDVNFLEKILAPKYAHFAQKMPREAEEILLYLAQGTRQLAKDSPELPIYKSIIDNLTDAIVSAAEFEAKPPANPHSRPGPLHIGHTGLKLLKLCQSTACDQRLVSRILNQILRPTSNCNIKNQITYGVEPFLPQLKTHLTSLGQEITDEPYATFAANVVKDVVETVLGPKPEEVVSLAQLNSLGCTSCAACKEMREFFLTEQKVVTTIISTGRTQAIRNHLDQVLTKARASSWGVSWSRPDSSQMRIKKPSSLVAPIIWMKNQAVGLRTVQIIGDEKVLQSILGEQYAAFASILGMKVPVQPTASNPLTQVKASNATLPNVGPSRLATAVSTTKKRPSIGGDEAPKRTKLSDDVIDLTDSPWKKR